MLHCTPTIIGGDAWAANPYGLLTGTRTRRRVYALRCLAMLARTLPAGLLWHCDLGVSVLVVQLSEAIRGCADLQQGALGVAALQAVVEAAVTARELTVIIPLHACDESMTCSNSSSSNPAAIEKSMDSLQHVHAVGSRFLSGARVGSEEWSLREDGIDATASALEFLVVELQVREHDIISSTQALQASCSQLTLGPQGTGWSRSLARLAVLRKSAAL